MGPLIQAWQLNTSPSSIGSTDEQLGGGSLATSSNSFLILFSAHWTQKRNDEKIVDARMNMILKLKLGKNMVEIGKIDLFPVKIKFLFPVDY